MDKYTDWLGQEIQVGTHILYAISSSHYVSLVYAEVLKIIPKTATGWESGYGRDFKLKVQPFFENTDLMGGRASTSGRGGTYVYDRETDTGYFKRVNPKPVTLQNVEKVTVFQISDEKLAEIDQSFEDAFVEAERKRKEREEANAE